MSILIKDMEMPKDGVYWCEIGVADDIAMITIHGEDRKSFPLVPVPPHGRLIDQDAYRDEFMNGVYALCNDDPDNYRANAIIDSYDNAPTVIEAEEGEHEQDGSV